MNVIHSAVDLLPHRPPMRLVEEVIDVVAGHSARARRVARPGDWYFQGHFPDEPVVPAVVLVELLSQTGGLAAASAGLPAASDETEAEAAGKRLRVAALGNFKFPNAARPNSVLEASARVVGRMGGMVKIEGIVTADGVRVAAGEVTLASVEQ